MAQPVIDSWRHEKGVGREEEFQEIGRQNQTGHLRKGRLKRGDGTF